MDGFFFQFGKIFDTSFPFDKAKVIIITFDKSWQIIFFLKKKLSSQFKNIELHVGGQIEVWKVVICWSLLHH